MRVAAVVRTAACEFLLRFAHDDLAHALDKDAVVRVLAHRKRGLAASRGEQIRACLSVELQKGDTQQKLPAAVLDGVEQLVGGARDDPGLGRTWS